LGKKREGTHFNPFHHHLWVFVAVVALGTLSLFVFFVFLPFIPHGNSDDIYQRYFSIFFLFSLSFQLDSIFQQRKKKINQTNKSAKGFLLKTKENKKSKSSI
jgi:O-antigen/teichoic acid export membrane protein